MYSSYKGYQSSHWGGYSASGLETAVNSAYPGNYATGSFRIIENNSGYAAVAARSNPYATIYSENTRGSSSFKSVSTDGAGERSATIYEFQPLVFLNPTRQRTTFVGDAAEIADFIRETFAKTTQKELPEDITITVSSRQVLQRIHPQFLKAGIVGLSLNGTSRQVFVAAGNLDEVMLVIGHELGHVFSPPLGNEQAEEAKAFAFEMAWARTIFLHDIAGLRNSINEAALGMRPAQNGLHDMAFAFVKAATLLAGKEPLQLHSEISAQPNFDINDFHNFEEAEAAATIHESSTQPVSYVPLVSATRHRPGYISGGYRNKSNVQNVPWFNNFSWADLGTGIYGMYMPLTASIFMNEKLLRRDLEQFHKTLGHEYILHHVMQLPDGYVAKILEETIFWVKDEEDKYKP